MLRMIPLLLILTLGGCVTSLARIPSARQQYPMRVAVDCENSQCSDTLVRVFEKSGLVLEAHDSDSPPGKEIAGGTEVVLQVGKVSIEKYWKRNAWCYVTTIPGFPAAFVFTSFILAPIFGPFGGYVWFPPNVAPVVTIWVDVSVELALGSIAQTRITRSASKMCKLRRSWMQLGRIDDGWFSTVLGGKWDEDYKTEKGEWNAFFRPEEADWSEVEKIAFHNIACKAVTWLEGVFKQLEEGW